MIGDGRFPFVRDLAFDALPPDVVAQAQRCLVDLIGVAAAGSGTNAAAIANAYAANATPRRDRDARILFDGRRAGLAGAAFAGASTIDALDAHDGHVFTKGHAGAAHPARTAGCHRRRQTRRARCSGSTAAIS
jgi:2-methylcitrate dehydratase PrpD